MIKNPESFLNNQEPEKVGAAEAAQGGAEAAQEAEESVLGEIISEEFKRSRREGLREMGNLTDDEIERIVESDEAAFRAIEERNKQKRTKK